MRLTLTLLVLIGTSGPALAMLPLPPSEAPQYVIKVNTKSDGASLSYASNVWVRRFGQGYRAQLYAINPYNTGHDSPLSPGQRTAASLTTASLDDVIAKNANATVFNGGYWDTNPYVPAGYLRVRGFTFHQLDF